MTPNCKSGFTLTELLVGMAILALMVVLLGGVVSNVSSTWIQAESKNDRLQRFRSFADLVTNELQMALLPVNRDDKRNLQFIVNPSQLSSDYLCSDAFFWQAPCAGDQAYGDVAEIGYFVKWNNVKPGRPQAQLCRFYTFAQPANPNFLIYKQTAGIEWLSDSILQAVAPADAANAYEGLIAENVVALFVECRDAYGKPITRAYDGGTFQSTINGFDSRQGYIDSKGTKSPDYTTLTGEKAPLCVLPASVHLSFVLLDSHSAERIQPNQKDALLDLGRALSAKNPKGDAGDFITEARANPSLATLASGLRAFETEVLMLNGR